MASILKRSGPDGKDVYQVQVRKRGYPPQIKTFDLKSNAQKWARMVEHQMETGLWRDSKEASRYTLSEALDRYLSDVTPRKRPATQRSENLSARSLKAVLGRYSLLQITPEKVAAYRDKRLQTLAADSVRIELALLSNLFNIAQREWSYSGLDNPVQRIKKPRVSEGRCPVLSEKQITCLLDECKKNSSKLLYPFVLLGLHTGCRSMELRGLRWSQVNLTEGYISLVGTETKPHRSRVVPLTQGAQSVLQELKKKAQSQNVVDMQGKPVGLVFPARGKLDEPRDMHMGFNRAVRDAKLGDLPGFGKLRIHDLRHLCGTFLVMNGVDLETVRDILGHKDLSTTQRYLHMVDEHKKKAISRIGHLGIRDQKGEQGP